MQQQQGAARILVVDDEAHIVQVVALKFRNAGLEVETAGDGDEALAMLERAHAEGAPFQLVVTDLQMPAMSGIEFLQALRSRGSTIPFVLMSGHATAEDVDMARRAGITAFLGKPFPPQELLKVLTTLLPRLRSAGNE